MYQGKAQVQDSNEFACLQTEEVRAVQPSTLLWWSVCVSVCASMHSELEIYTCAGSAAQRLFIDFFNAEWPHVAVMSVNFWAEVSSSCRL